MYKIRLSFNSLEAAVKTLASSNLMGSKKSLIINNTKEFSISNKGKYYNKFDFKLETYFNGDSSICYFAPMLRCFKDTLDYSKLIYEGTYESFGIYIKNLSDTVIIIPENSNLFKLILFTKEFYNLDKQDKSKGLKSLEVEIEIYINDKLKPLSKEQAIANRLTLVLEEPVSVDLDSIPEGIKFLAYNFKNIDFEFDKEYVYIN